KGEGEHRIVASALAAGTNFQVALKADGTVWTWGQNAYGQLGDGTKITRGFPVQVKKPDGATDSASVFTTATAIAAGTKHMLVVADGFVYAAGDNTYGQLGNGKTKTTASIVVPVMVDENTPLSGVVAVAAGDNFSMALRNDGTVWTWGDNTSGQLGDGTTTTSAYAVQVLKGTSGTNSHEDNEYYLSNISAIAAGASFSAALKSDGTVYTWGNNSKGQLGDGTAVNKPTPIQVLRGESPEEAENVAPAGSDYLQNITKIAAGNNHMLALSKTGYVWSWGDNTYGQNGDWTTNNNAKHYVPLQVRDIPAADQSAGNTTGKLKNISSVAANNNQSFAITNDGYLYAWGYDGLNQLGLGNTTANETLPKLVLKGAVQSDDEYIKFVSNVAPGINNTVAELSDGYVYTWSRNAEWQIGKFNAYEVNTPAYTGERPEDLLEFFSDTEGNIQIPYLSDISTGDTLTINAIKYHHMYGFNLETDDTHTLATDDTFTYKSSNDNVASVDTNGVITAGTHTGTVIITVTSEKTGITSSISLNVKQSGRRVMPMVSGGNAHAVALRDNGDVYVWGRNNEGQLGDGTTVSKTYPIKVNFPGGEAIKYVHAGMNVTYAVTEDGKVYAWGQNTNGLIGNGTTDNSAHSTPELVQELTSTGTLQPLSDIARIESGNTHTLALTNDGHVYAWGQNTYGQLGNGDTSNSDQIFRDANTPAGIYAAQKVYRGESASESSAELDSWYIQDVIDIAAGNSFSAALKADGTVWAWGLNNNYQLGINDTVTRPVPMQVYAGASSGTETYLKNITAIAAGEAHMLALSADGSVYSWGYNNWGQLGNGTTSTATKPVKVSTLTNVVAVSANYYNSMASTLDGSVYTWGWNEYGQIGDGSYRYDTYYYDNSWGHHHDHWSSPTYMNKTVPTQVVKGVTESDTAYMNNVWNISAGTATMYVIREDGFVYAWGSNSNGQTGDDTNDTDGQTVSLCNGTRLEYHAMDNTAVQVGDKEASMLLIENATLYTDGTPVKTYTDTDKLPVNTTIGRNQTLQLDINNIEQRYLSGFNVKNYNADKSGKISDVGGTLVFSSVDESIAVVDNTGLISVPANAKFGETTIRVENTDTGFVGLLVVRVKRSADTIAVPMVAAGNNYSVALREDGTLWAWGINDYGQLGDGTKITRSYPVRVRNTDGTGLLENIVYVAAGGTVTVAIDKDGNVYAWGEGSNGQNGNGTKKITLIPTPVVTSYSETTDEETGKVTVTSTPLTGAVAAAAGTNHAMALMADGTVYAWGYNTSGQVGVNGTSSVFVATPVQKANGIEPIQDIIKISSLSETSTALARDGQVYAWGKNLTGTTRRGESTVTEGGYLGTGYTIRHKFTATNSFNATPVYENRLRPFRVITANTLAEVGTLNGYFKDAVDIAAGTLHTVALKADGEVYTWGYNANYNLGNGTTTNTRFPASIAQIGDGVSHVYALNNGGAAMSSDGKVYTWGLGTSGQNGNGSATLTAPAIVLPGESGAADNLDNIWYTSAGHNHIVTFRGDADNSKGYIYAWGYNQYGQLGDSSFVNASAPRQVGDRDARVIEIMNAVVSDDNTGYGVTGTTYTGELPVLVRITEGQTLTIDPSQINERYYEGFNLFAENTLDTSDYTGNYKFYSSDETVAKVEEIGGSWVVTPEVDKEYHRGGQTTISVVNTVTGASGAFIINVYGGKKTPNSDSRDGSGFTKQTATPLVSTGLYHSVALKYDGTIFAWGRNDSGQVSTKDGALDIMNTPVQIYSVEYDSEGNASYTLLENIIDVAAGGFHSLAVDSNGHVWSWGNNDYKQLGDGTTDSRGAAQLVMTADGQPMENIVAVAAGMYHSLALTKDGHVYAWGRNNYNQLGTSSTDEGDFVKYPVHVTQGTSASGTNESTGKPDEYLSHIIQISAGDYYSAALKADGTVYVWGTNQYTVGGVQSSTLTTSDTRMAPYQIVNGEAVSDDNYIQNIARISAGSNHLMMLTNKHYGETDVFAIGLNGNYQLGNGKNTNANAPVLALTPEKITSADRTVNNIVNIAAGQAHSMAIGETTAASEREMKYSTWAWGSNSNGQIGMNSSSVANYSTPQHVKSQYLEDKDKQTTTSPYIEGAFTLSAGANSTVVDLEGYVYMWGINDYSQIGDFTTETRYYPYQVGELEYKSIIFKEVYVVNRNTGAVEEYYQTLPKHIEMRKDQLLYIDINQMFNRNYKGFTLLSDTEEYPVDRFENDGTWVNPYADSPTNQVVYPIRDGEDFIHFTTSDDTVATVPIDESNYETKKFDGVTERRYIVVDPVENTEKFGSTVISAHNTDPYVKTDNEEMNEKHAYAGYTGAVNISIVPGAEIPPMVVSKGNHSIAINILGEVWTWGRNNRGQLGDGTTVDRSYPTQVMKEDGTPLNNVMIVAAGESHSVALTRDGVLYTWGDNTYGQLGNGQTSSVCAYATHPVNVSGENNSSTSLSDMLKEKNESISNIIAGKNHTLAVSNQGKLYSWGANESGQLGINSTAGKYFPVQVRGYNGGGFLTDVILIGAGADHSLAVRTDGSVWSWGKNNHGQLGQGTNGPNNTYKNMITPNRVLKGEYDTGNTEDKYIKNVDALSAGENFTIVTTRDRNVYAWGENTYGQLGNGTNRDNSTPVHVKSLSGEYLSGISMVSGGQNHVIAMSNDNKIYMWGDNSKQQYHAVSDTTIANQITEKDLLNPENDSVFTAFSRVTAGWNHSVILTNNGYLWSLGNNTYGQLGDMTETDSADPVRVGFKAEDIMDFGSVTVTHSDGSTTVYPTADQENVPGQINITTAETVQFDAGSVSAMHHMAFNLRSIHTKNATTDVSDNIGTIKFYSSNPNIASVDENTGLVTPNSNNRYGKTTITAYSEKKDGENTYVYVAETVISVGVETADEKKSVPMTSSGVTHTVVLKPNGTVWAWGQDSYGQLGDNDSANKAYAVQVVTADGPLAEIAEVAAGGTHSLALSKTGIVYAWGNNASGQLGIDSSSSKSAVARPIAVPSGRTLPKFVAIAAGENHSVALAEDGSVWAWGANGDGQLGYGDQFTYTYPVEVKQGASASTTSAVTTTQSVQKTDSDGNPVVDGDGNPVMETITTTEYKNNIYLEDIIAISAEGNMTVAVKSNGTLLSWGLDTYGASGTGSTSKKYVPVRAKASDLTGVDNNGIPLTTTSDIDYLSNVTAIAAGANQTVAIIGDGSAVVVAGDNQYGQLGIGDESVTSSPLFVQVKNTWGAPKAVELAAGYSHVIMRTDDDRVYSWGNNPDGQLGLGDTVLDNSTAKAYKPTRVKKGNSYSSDNYIENIWAISAGGNNSTAIKHDVVVGSDVVWAWGDNGYRQLGNMIDNQSYMPVQSGERETRRVIVLKIDKYTTEGALKGTYQVEIAADTKDVSLTNIPQISVSTNEYLQVDTAKIYEVYQSGFVLEVSDNKVQVTDAKFKSSNTEVIYVDGAETSGKLVPTEAGVHNSAVITVTNPTTKSEGVFAVNVTKYADAVASSNVSTGSNHTLVLKEDGTVWAWGDNTYGQLGDGPYNKGVTGGTVTDDYIHRTFNYTGTGDLNYTAFPVQVKTAENTPLTNVISAAASKNYNVAVDKDHSVYIWGNVNGLSYTYATKMTGFEDKKVISVEAGYTHFLALSEDGYVYSWGVNSDGQLGNNSTANVTDIGGVAQVVGQGAENMLYDIVQISAYGNNSAALRSDGTVWTWGDNASGQLGDGTYTDKTTPIQVIAGESSPEYDNRDDNANYNVYLQNIKKIAVGLNHMIALAEDTSVYVWGDNTSGQLGFEGENKIYPVKVDTAAFTADTITGVYAGKNISAIVTQQGNMFVSGSNTGDTEILGSNVVGRLGTGTEDENITAFTSVETGLKYEKDNNNTNINGVRNVALGDSHTSIISKFGYVWAWGANNNYQLGDITYNTRFTPVISGDRETRYMTVNYAYVVHEDGSTEVVADTDNGISMPSALTIAETDKLHITKVTYDYYTGFNVAYFDSHSERDVDAANGEVTWASSDNSVATIVNGVITPNDQRRYSNTSISVQDVKSGAMGVFILNIKRSETTVAVPMVAAGDDFAIALRSDGTVWAWGNNDKGQLGVGKGTELVDRPVKITSLKNIVYITAGQYHAGAVDKDGYVYTWGYNEYGQIGNGTANNYELKTHRGGNYYGEDYCWSPDSTRDHNNYHSGMTHYTYNKMNNNAYTPVKLTTVSNIVTISAGDNHTVAMTKDGKVYAWGDNTYNQIGSPQTYADAGYMGHYRLYMCSGRTDGNEATRVPAMTTPVRVSGARGYGYLEDIIDIKAGGEFTIALKKDGTAYVWGRNDSGEMGDGTSITYSTSTYQTENKYAYGYYNNNQSHGWHVTSTFELKKKYNRSYNKYYPVQVKAGEQILDYEHNSVNAASVSYNYLQEITTISAGSKHAAVITRNQDVYTWGKNDHGQLGNGTTNNSLVPTHATELEGAVQIASGSNQAFMIRNDGKVLGWGDNTPPPYKTFSETLWTCSDYVGSFVTAVIATQKYTTTDPDEVTNQLGIEDTTVNMQMTPANIVKGNTINAKPEEFSEYMTKFGNISTRGAHTVMYSTKEGTVWSWGTGDKGQIGDFTQNSRTFPVQTGPTDYIRPDIVDGGIYTVDDNSIVTEFSTASPMENIVTLDSSQYIKINLDNVYRLISPGFNLAFTEKESEPFHWTPDMKLTALDENLVTVDNTNGTIVPKKEIYGETAVMLRDDNSDIAYIFKLRIIPTQEEKYGRDKKVAAPKIVNGSSHVVALKSNGTVWTWGLGTDKQLGDGSSISDNQPVQVLGVGGGGFLTNIVDIAAGSNFSVALDNNGTVYTWGYGNNEYPVVTLSDVAAIGTANSTIYAVMNDRTVKYWTYGGTASQLIKGESASTGAYFENALEVTGGINHNTILRDDGHVWTWGTNDDGQLGNTLRKYLNYPALVVVGESPYNSVYLNNVMEVRSGANHNTALIKDQNADHTQYDVPADKAFTTKNGHIYSWGDNSVSQLGNGGTDDSYKPVRAAIPDDEVINHISAKDNSGFASTDATNVWAWGDNTYGQKGLAAADAAPAKITDKDGAVWAGALNGGAGTNFMSSYITDGTVWTWGNNASGQLGDQTNTDKAYPVQAITEPPAKVVRAAHVTVTDGSGNTRELEYPNEIMIDLDETVTIDRVVIEETLPFNLFNDKLITEIDVD
ncbi:MAG: hypothetical protein MR413_04125, partial [Clostridia bacterium]|nr:hypothetical protein [Clostridia bacterium]